MYKYGVAHFDRYCPPGGLSSVATSLMHVVRGFARLCAGLCGSKVRQCGSPSARNVSLITNSLTRLPPPPTPGTPTTATGHKPCQGLSRVKRGGAWRWNSVESYKQHLPLSAGISRPSRDAVSHQGINRPVRCQEPLGYGFLQVAFCVSQGYRRCTGIFSRHPGPIQQIRTTVPSAGI